MMHVQINAVHFSADSKLEEYIQQRLNKLTTFYDKIQGAEVYLKLENEGGPVRDKVVEIKLTVPGAILFAKETERTFEKATDYVAEDLRTQLVKYKDKIRAK